LLDLRGEEGGRETGEKQRERRGEGKKEGWCNRDRERKEKDIAQYMYIKMHFAHTIERTCFWFPDAKFRGR